MKKSILITLLFSIFLVVLVACGGAEEETETETEIETEPATLTLPNVLVESVELPTGYFNVYELETDELIHESYTQDDVDQMELDDTYEIRPEVALPVFTVTISSDDEEAPLPSLENVDSDHEGQVLFDNITFEEIGTFSYSVFQIELETDEETDEKIDENKDKDKDEDEDYLWALDSAIYLLTVEVVENEELNTLEATLKVELEEEIVEEIIFVNELVEQEEEEEKEENKNQSDESNEGEKIDTSTYNSSNWDDNTNVSNDSSSNWNNSSGSNNSSSNWNNSSGSDNVNANQSTNNSSNSNHNTTPACTDVWVETSPAVSAVEERWEQQPIYHVLVVLPRGTEFSDWQTASNYMIEHNQTSISEVQRGGDWVLAQAGVPSRPAQGHWECR